MVYSLWTGLLTDEWDQAVTDSYEIVAVTGQAAFEKSLFIEQPPADRGDVGRHGDQAPPRAQRERDAREHHRNTVQMPANPSTMSAYPTMTPLPGSCDQPKR